MKTLTRLTLLASGLLASALAAGAADIEWRATLTMGGSRSFSLSSLDGQQRAWVSEGESFLGYQVVGLDADGKSLKVARDGVEEVLQLADAKITDAPAATDTLAQAEALMNSMKFNEMIEKMVQQQRDSMRQMVRQMAGGREATPEMLALQDRIHETMMQEIFGSDFGKDVAKIYAKTLSPDELRGLTQFYDSAAGRAFIEKQPEIMQETMQIIQPRMMQAMPKIQAIIAESRELPTPPAPPPAPPSAPPPPPPGN